MQLDMFGAPSPDANRKTTLPRGHAAPPGSGPKDETCRTCEHYTIVHTGSRAGPYRKCGAARAKWTRGPGSDIRARDPACRLWERSSD